MIPLADIRRLPVGFVLISFITAVSWKWPQLSNATTVALAFLIVVLLIATTARLWIAVVTSLVAMLAVNFFFFPPVGTLTISDPQNWIALVAFLVVSLVAINLSAVARDRAQEAVTRRDELGRLLDLSHDVLLITDGEAANSSVAGFIARRFELAHVAICLPRTGNWAVFESASPGIALNPRDLTGVFDAVKDDTGRESSAHLPTACQTLKFNEQDVRIVPLRIGGRAIGLLAAEGRPIESGTLDAIAGLAAIAIERVQFLDERKRSELVRHGEELKSGLLASLSHDLRTPVTAIRVAADNLKSTWANEHERREQAELIVTEVDRLTHVFQNILEMARIDAGAVSEDARWVTPSEIVEAARSRVEDTLRSRTLELAVESDRLVRLDPRLPAAALAHILENAVHYAPEASTIHVSAAVSDIGLTMTVRDYGRGIAADDLPHVFERFYRGAEAQRNRSGTGMGLAIARGILAAEGGGISVENCADGGARFTIVAPADVK
jgi:two-component system sensor histidine kinase KdpD